MDLPSISNAPREFSLGGVTYRARALTLGQFGEVLAWLEDRLPPEEGRVGPPLFSGEASRLALASTEGLAVVLHLALLSCQPAMSRDIARALAATMDTSDEDRLMAIAFRRRPTRAPSDDDEGSAKDLAEIEWGPIFEALSRHRPEQYAAVAGLTLDQFDCLAAKGETEGPDTLSPAEVQRMWEAARANGDGVAPTFNGAPEP